MSINDDSGHRIIFPPGEQGKYLWTVRARLGLSWRALSARCGCTRGSMRRWAAEESRSMPMRVVGVLHHFSGIAPPEGEVISAAEFWRRHGQAAGCASAQVRTKAIRRPGRTPRLAEFCAILLGDGCIYSQTDKQLSPPRHYVRLSFGNSSRPLVRGVGEVLCGLGYRVCVRFYEKKENSYVRLNHQAEIRRYMREVGTANRYRHACYLAAAGRARADGVRGWADFTPAEVKLIRN